MIPYYLAILWNPGLPLASQILKDIPEIIDTREVNISKEHLKGAMDFIYKLDKKCNLPHVVLPKKIARLKEYGEKCLFVRFKAKNGWNNKPEVIKIRIRRKYRKHIKKYLRGMMIHITDRKIEAEKIWMKYI